MTSAAAIVDAAIVDAATWTAGVVGGYLVIRGTVAVLRRRVGAVRTAAGVGLAATLASGGVAFAASGGGHGTSRPPSVSADWPTGRRADRTSAVTVRPGDCLWDIAAHRLAHPTSAHVAAAWPRWWLVNRAVIGADPDLVRPGQLLRPPASTRSPS
jgi:nucleoid-associated protein YgaU